VVLKDFLVSFHIHGRIGWKEEYPSIYISSSKSHLTIKLAGCFNVLSASQEFSLSYPEGLLTLFLVARTPRNVDSLLYMTVLQPSSVQCWYFLAKVSQSLGLHLSGEERLVDGDSSGKPQLFHKETPDVPQ
jgi:hypothetical protein